MDHTTPADTSRAQALAKLEANPRVNKIRLIVAMHACPACRAQEGAYLKGSVPELPTPGCSHPLGCRCFYEPSLTEIYP